MVRTRRAVGREHLAAGDGNAVRVQDSPTDECHARVQVQQPLRFPWPFVALGLDQCRDYRHEFRRRIGDCEANVSDRRADYRDAFKWIAGSTCDLPTDLL